MQFNSRANYSIHRREHRLIGFAFSRKMRSFVETNCRLLQGWSAKTRSSLMIAEKLKLAKNTCKKLDNHCLVWSAMSATMHALLSTKCMLCSQTCFAGKHPRNACDTLRRDSSSVRASQQKWILSSRCKYRSINRSTCGGTQRDTHLHNRTRTHTHYTSPTLVVTRALVSFRLMRSASSDRLPEVSDAIRLYHPSKQVRPNGSVGDQSTADGLRADN